MKEFFIRQYKRMIFVGQMLWFLKPDLKPD